MADSDKNILITPSVGVATETPSIVFTGYENDPMTLNVTDGISGGNKGIEIVGSDGQAFNVTPELGSGSIFRANDISGIPLIEAKSNGVVALNQFGIPVNTSVGSVGIGTDAPNGLVELKSGHTVGDTSGVHLRFNYTGNGANDTIGSITFGNAANDNLAIIQSHTVGSNTVGSLRFMINGQGRAVINASGLTVTGTVAATSGNSTEWNTAYNHSQAAHAPSNANYITNNNQLINGANYITGSQTITLSGDVSGSGTTSITTTVADDSHSHSNYVSTGGGTITSGYGNTTLRIETDNIGRALVVAGKSALGQGTGAFEVTQDGTYGGGMSYNGDGTPAFVAGETADWVTFYAMNAGTRTEVFSYAYTSTGDVTFNGGLTWSGGTSSQSNTAYNHSQSAHAPSDANNYVFPYQAVDTTSDVTFNTVGALSGVKSGTVHFSWSDTTGVFTNAVADMVSYLSFGNNQLWGWVEVTLTGGFVNTPISGKYTKRYKIGRNATSTIHNQSSEVPSSFGEISANFKLGDFEISGNDLRIPIYNVGVAGNAVEVYVEGHVYEGTGGGADNIDDILGSLSLSAPAVVSNSETRDYYSIISDRLGIGTTTPETLFHVNSNSGSAQENFFNNDGTGAQIITLRSKMNTESWSHSRIYFDGADDQNGNVRYGTIESFIVDNTDTSEDGRMTFSTVIDGTDTETMHITSGNLGIGTASPTDKFEVHGTSGELLSVADDLSGVLFSANDVSGLPVIEAHASGNVVLSEYGGHVGIGLDTPAYSTQRLSLTGTSSSSENETPLFIHHNVASGTEGWALGVSRLGTYASTGMVSALALGSDTSTNGLISSNNSHLRFGSMFAGVFTEAMIITGNIQSTTPTKVGIGAPSPDVALHLGTVTDVDLSTGGGTLQIGLTNTYNMVVDDNEIQARNNGAASELHLNSEGSNVNVNGNIVLHAGNWSSYANNYVHPTESGSDLSVVLSNLTGAGVISGLNIAVTTNTLGHVTGTTSIATTRNLTLADLGYTGATNANNYSFPYTIAQSATASSVPVRNASGYLFGNYINMTDDSPDTGTVTEIITKKGDDYYRGCSASRVRTFLNVANGANNITNNNQLTNGASYITGLNIAQVTSGNVPITNIHTYWSANDMATATGAQAALQIYNQGVGNDAFMSFHASGDYAIYFGLDADSNKLSVGGWTYGASKDAIYHEGNKPSLADLGYTGATNANYITNNNQLTNGANYITDGNTGWNNSYGFVTSSGVTSVATGGGLTGGTITSTGTLSHADTSSQGNVNNSGQTFVQDLTFDTYGHVTGVTSATASGGGGVTTGKAIAMAIVFG